MTEKIIGNSLSFKTFGFLKVNETTIEVPSDLGKSFNIKSHEKLEIEEFSNLNYGVSNDSIKMNESFGNLNRNYIAKTGEILNEELNLCVNDENNRLLDTHTIIAEEDSTINLLLDYSSNDAGEKFRNSIIKILAKKNSIVNLFVIQTDDNNTTSLETIFAKVYDNAKVKVCQFELGSKELYTNLKADLIGEESELDVDSIYFGFDDNRLNMLYELVHHGEASNCDVLVNGALKGNSFKTFKSTLDFKEGSGFSKGSEEEYAILLDDTVRSLSVPVLLAHEDNVEGNHAASAGQIDKELLFYIMSRGFSLSEAENLIIQSRFSNAIDELPRAELKTKIWDKINEIVRG